MVNLQVPYIFALVGLLLRIVTLRFIDTDHGFVLISHSVFSFGIKSPKSWINFLHMGVLNSQDFLCIVRIEERLRQRFVPFPARLSVISVFTISRFPWPCGFWSREWTPRIQKSLNVAIWSPLSTRQWSPLAKIGRLYIIDLHMKVGLLPRDATMMSWCWK